MQILISPKLSQQYRSHAIKHSFGMSYDQLFPVTNLWFCRIFFGCGGQGVSRFSSNLDLPGAFQVPHTNSLPLCNQSKLHWPRMCPCLI